ncbi:P2Y purinoceptor 8 [Pelobates cultripes]|uniref:P2Y purinoceptor 8 n=1 Tax=Pelobates cultripes TaxID=61616 RepID=A0AAD1VLC1_PELCU|nr:P2Y purinoceptor 8 [Pelobates cultripes]CAH2220537.1 P2Y purinoceptor 8 [Pelobates cultripes]
MDVWSLPNDSKPDNDTLAMLENRSVTTILPVVYSFVTLISIPGNLVSLWILVFHSKPITSSIVLMINLSVADLVLAIFLPFQIIYHINNNNWIFGKGLCNVVSVLFYANMYCSILTIMSISIERYLGIVYPMKSSTWRRKRYAVAAIIFIWISTLLSLYPMESTDLTYKVSHLNITTCFDVLKWNMLPNLITWAVFILGLFFFLFLIPSVVTVFCYIRIIWTLVRTSNRNGTGKERRPISLALIVLFVFVTCFAPNNFILMIHTIYRLFYNKSYYHAYKLTLTMSCLSSCLDPFLYYFASKDFRKKVLEVWSKTFSRDKIFEGRRGSLFSGTFSSGHAEIIENGNGCKYKLQESDL